MSSEAFEYVIPQGVFPGKKVFVKLPSENTVEIRIPPGYYAGSTLFLNPDSGAYLLDLGLKTNAKKDPQNKSVLPVISKAGQAKPAPVVEADPVPVEEPAVVEEPVAATEYASPFAEDGEDVEVENLPEYESFFSFKKPPTPNLQAKLELRNVEASETEVKSNGRHKALLTAVNYAGTEGESKVNIEHLEQARALLETQLFEDSVDTMASLTDTDPNPALQPTKQNLLNGLQWLAHNAAAGDTLVFGFHGHVGEVADPSATYEDGVMPALLPADFASGGVVTDMDVWNYLISEIPAGVKLICVVGGAATYGLGNKWNFETGVWEAVANSKQVAADVVVLACKPTSKAFYQSLGGLVQQKGANPSLLELAQDLDCDFYSSQKFEPEQREFNVQDGSILPNKNTQLGQTVSSKIEAGVPNTSTVAGSMLLAAGVISAGNVPDGQSNAEEAESSSDESDGED